MPRSSASAAFPRATRRYVGAVATCALLAAAAPALLLFVDVPGEEALALLASGVAILLLINLLRPLGAVASGLKDCLGDAATADQAAPAGPAGGMLADVRRLLELMDGMRQRLGNRHPVTGLPTREPFLSELAHKLQDPSQQLVLAVFRFADFDRLAAFDHAAADRALDAFAQRLKGSLPASRPPAQVDRDCFAAWTPAGRAAGARELQALHYVLGQELTAGELKLAPKVSIGAAAYPDDGATGPELLTRAIAALETGQRGRQPLAFFSAQTSADAKDRFSIEQELRGIVGRNELTLHFQPVVDAEAGRIVGAEALLRWNHPTLGLLPPGRFIAILEQSPMMAEVGMWVLDAACREARGWRDRGLADLKMAVNLSTTQCCDPRLGDMVMRTLERHGLPPSSLELELTETAAIEEADHTRRLLENLRSYGVSVAIDDFGAGFSNLSYLKNLPFSKLKIDREFVTEVNARQDSRAICAALVALARGLGISLLAEGVETLEEVETLRGLGCRLFQGYYFARPMDGEAFLKAVDDQSWLAALTPPPNPPLKVLGRRAAS